jgi:hypothetical protein
LRGRIREPVLIELAESGRESTLDAGGQWLPLLVPVHRQELCQFVGALNDTAKGLFNDRAGPLSPRELTQEKERHVAQLEPITSLRGKVRHLLRLDLRNQFSDPLCDLAAGFVKGVLPQEARRHSPAELAAGVNRVRGPTFVGQRRQGRYIEAGHRHLLVETGGNERKRH